MMCRMFTKALNEDILWKGRLQQAQHSPDPVRKKADMILHPLKYHNGQDMITGREHTNIQQTFCDRDGLTKSYEKISATYWEGVNKRKMLYRLLHRY